MMQQEETTGTSSLARHIHALPRILIAALAFMLAGSVFHKALVSSFTHDESYNYNHYVTAPVQDILTFKTATSNNHPLNTLLMKAVTAVGVRSEIALRFPNILGFLVFSLLLYCILLKMQSIFLLDAVIPRGTEATILQTCSDSVYYGNTTPGLSCRYSH